MTDDPEIEVEASEDEKGTGQGAPYMSYKGFVNLLNKMYEDGAPAVFDKSYFGNQSGSLTAQIRTALRILGLIDEKNSPTSALDSLVARGPDDRKTELERIARRDYADALALGPTATAGQLASVFRARGLSGATVDKAMSFFLGMVDDLGISVSPHFKKGRATISSGNGGARKRKVARSMPDAEVKSDKPDRVEVTQEAQRAKYIEMLMALAENADKDAQASILDRIEQALDIKGASLT